MPVIKILHICSVSSEDPSHPADNLLNLETYRKWKCATAGEKKATVVLQLEKSSQIHTIDIGNSGSAFVEVLVGRSTEPDKYEAFLGMSTFMTSQESKQSGSSANSRVRLFGKDKFSKTTADQKWDRVKIVCTQPYNKSEKYGLSFIKLHSPPSSEDTPTDTPTSPSKQQPTKLGAFTLREEKEDLPLGSLFFRSKTMTSSSKSITSSPGVSTAAQARMATAAALKSDQSESPVRKPDQSSSSTSRSTPGGNMVAKKRQATPTGAGGTPKRRKGADTPSDSSRKDDSIPFEDIMCGVVIALSGFKNPFRGELRGKALEMGAKYEADWGPSCTHLICAFANTPKFNQVKGKHGLIVKKEWVLDSYVKKRRLPARKYRLSSGSGDTSSSEEDLYDKKEEELFGKGKKKNEEVKTKEDASTRRSTSPVNKGEDPYGGSTDEEMDTDVKSKPLPRDADNESSECDTEDEIERVRQQQARNLHGDDPVDDPYGGSTDEDNEEPPSSSATTVAASNSSSSKSLLELPNFFSKCVFLLYGEFSTADRRLLNRYITAYSGAIESYMSSRITHVLTQADWDESFDQALTENSALVFVKPKWIFMCHKKQACVPYQPYVVVPV